MKKLLLSLAILLSCYLAIAPTAFAATSVQLQTDKTTLSPEGNLSVTLNLSSSDNTLGTDVVLTYDPAILKPTIVTPGSVYPTYAEVDTTSADGTLFISGVSDFTQGTIPNGLFATVTFTAISPGTTTVALALDPEDSSLSGVIPFDDSSSNLLTQTPTPLTITVSQPNIFVRLWNTIVSFFSFLVPK